MGGGEDHHLPGGLGAELSAPARELLVTLAGLAREGGWRLWMAGGTVRDMLLGRSSPDLDLAVAGPALELGRALAARTGLTFVPLSRENQTCRLVGRGLQVDLTGLRAPDLEGDLRARDFTVNALAWDLEDLLARRGPIVDPTGGRADLAAGRLRAAGPGVLRADPLRVLRAFRLLASHGFELAPELRPRLQAAAPGLFRVARERIAQEWRLMLAGAQAGRAVREMERAQVLTRLIPELARGRGLEQNPYHHLDILEHNLTTLEELARIAAQPERFLGELGRELSDYLSRPERRYRLMTAALLHDVGKPHTRREKEPGWATFYRHDIQGAELAQRACAGLGLSRADTGAVVDLVALHMRPFHLMGARSRGRLSKRALRRLLQSAGDHLPGLMALALADTMAGRGPQRPPQAEESLVDLFRLVVRRRDRELARLLAAPPLIDGRELMAATGLAPGPEVGRLLGLVREAQMEGKVGDKDQALVLARRLLAEPGGRSG